MGGKKGPEKNRKYEKERRDRFNEQFTELHNLLPDFKSSMIKVTKSEIIGKTIEYLKDTQTKNRTLEKEFENEKNKISELQKKVSSLLHIVKELIKLVHKSNIGFPSSLPVDDLKSFTDVYVKCKRKSKESLSNEKRKKKRYHSECTESVSDVDFADEYENTRSKSKIAENRVESVAANVHSAAPTVVTAPAVTVTASVQQTVCTTREVMDVELPKVLRIDSNPLILPNANLVAVSDLQNAVLNSVQNAQTLLLNKAVTVPTFILMQNNFVPINTVQHISASRRPLKMIVPKQAANTTKTTFINKKPIPAVRLYKPPNAPKDNPRRTPVPKRKRGRRSKGILVKYPKRKSPAKSKKRETRVKQSAKQSEAATAEERNETTSASDLRPCDTVNENPYPEDGRNVVDKAYACSGDIFDAPDIQTTGQFIDFFENNTTRCLGNNDVENGTASQGKEEKRRIDNFGESSFERPYVNASIGCDLIETSVPKEQTKETADQPCETGPEKNLNYLPISSTNDSLLLKYVPSNGTGDCAQPVSSVSPAEVANENAVLDKRKPTEKEITPLTIHCDLSQNKSVPKDLGLSLIDDKKHYESSFDDLFTSLQVPSSGQNADSISPTAAFLHSFPLVSSCKNVDLLPEHEDDSNTAGATASMTILQIGNLESPSTMLFTSNKSAGREGLTKGSDKMDDAGFGGTYCGPGLELESVRKEKAKDTSKEITTRVDPFSFGDTMNFKGQPKNVCTKEAVSQNVPFYPTSTNTTFPSYNIFTKYNDISAVTCSYYSLSSQPFPITKTVDPITDFNSWMPSSVYNQEEATSKDRNKRDKCTSTPTFKGHSTNEVNTDRTKSKKPAKQSGARPLVNWMTTPDLRSVPDTTQSADVFSLPKEDAINGSTFFNSPGVQNNSNFNVTYSSSSEYYLENQNYADPQFNSCKIAYSSANPCNYSWSPSKSTLPSLPMDTHNMILPSTLPTLVGDLALGNTSFNSYDPSTKKYESEKKKDSCKNYPKSMSQYSSSFLSVTQLVDDKGDEKTLSKRTAVETNCRFEDERDKCYKENYGLMTKGAESAEYCKKTSSYVAGCKDSKSQNIKCKKDATPPVKYNHNVGRCISKENKKDTRHGQQKSFNEYPSQNCRMLTKEVNPLSNKNSNYSAESLIGSSTHQNTCSGQSYFPYDNTTGNYGNCGSNEYPKKRIIEETEPLTNVGYYPNTNYVYHNNFQGFNNYGFSNQCYNNYSSQIQPSTGNGFQKKRDDNYNVKQDSSSDWYKESFPSYNTIVPSEFAVNNQKLDAKCKQPFSNKYNQGQKNTINSETYNKYYQCGPAASSSTMNHAKSSCNFNSTYSFSQAGGQHCSEASCLTPGYEMKSNNRNPTNSMNSNNIHPATTLTNFNLSTIFPEINDKHCSQSRVNAIGHEKINPEYTNKVNMEEMNYNYLIQPTVESTAEPPPVYGSSTFQIQHFTDFSSRKAHK